jgi:hypothetical protein
MQENLDWLRPLQWPEQGVFNFTDDVVEKRLRFDENYKRNGLVANTIQQFKSSCPRGSMRQRKPKKFVSLRGESCFKV